MILVAATALGLSEGDYVEIECDGEAGALLIWPRAAYTRTLPRPEYVRAVAALLQDYGAVLATNTSVMTVHRECAEVLGLKIHEPDQVGAGDRCGLCDPHYLPEADRATFVNHHQRIPRCCRTPPTGNRCSERG